MIILTTCGKFRKDKNLFTEKTNPRTLMSSWEKNVLSWTSLSGTYQY